MDETGTYDKKEGKACKKLKGVKLSRMHAVYCIDGA